MNVLKSALKRARKHFQRSLKRARKQKNGTNQKKPHRLDEHILELFAEHGEMHTNDIIATMPDEIHNQDGIIKKQTCLQIRLKLPTDRELPL